MERLTKHHAHANGATKPCGCVEPVTCLACDPPIFERNNYFAGKLMTERDFFADTIYLLGKQRLHARFLHGWGTVCGLRIIEHPVCPDLRIIVEPGLAVDCCGREIYLRHPVELEISALLKTLQGYDPKNPPTAFYLCVRYEECYSEEVPVLFSECACGEDACHPNRIKDGYRFALLTESDVAVERKKVDARLALRRSHVIPITGAYGLAVDDQMNRFYVLTMGDRAHVYVYSTEDQMPISGAIGVDTRPSAFALASDRQRLYVVTTYAPAGGSEVAHAILTLDTSRMQTASALRAVIDTGGREDDKGTILVSPMSDDKRYVYITQGNSVLAFDIDDLENTGKPTPAFSTPSADPLDAPVALAASKDGQRLYVAERNGNAVAVVDVSTPPSVRIIGRVAVASEPAALQVSADEEWVFVASRSNTVSAIHRPTLEQLFANGADRNQAVAAITTVSLAASGEWPARTPVALGSSPSGVWLYVLDQGGHLLAVNARRLANKALLTALPTPGLPPRAVDRAEAVVDKVAVLPVPTSVALSPASGKVFVSSPGTAIGTRTGPKQGPAGIDSMGGVAVLEGSEAACERIFDWALEPCPSCKGDECLILAHITYVEERPPGEEKPPVGQARPVPHRPPTMSPSSGKNWLSNGTNHDGNEQGGQETATGNGPPAATRPRVMQRHINNKTPARRFLYSTEILTDAIKCILEHGGAGAAGPPGAPGEKGEKGDPGIGLDPQLTHITGINWNHGEMTQPEYLRMIDKDQGFIVAFDNPIQLDTVNHHTFLVSVRLTMQAQPWAVGMSALWQEVYVPGTIEAVEARVERERCRVVDWRDVKEVPTDRLTKAVRFRLVRTKEPGSDLITAAQSIRIILKGDFILDKPREKHPGRPTDLEHLHRLVPNGNPLPGLGPMAANMPCGSGDWVPGGDFESWIDITSSKGGKQTEPGQQTPGQANPIQEDLG